MKLLKNFNIDGKAENNLLAALTTISQETMEEIEFSNFVQKHLVILFEALNIPMPRLTFDISYTKNVQIISILYKGMSWVIYNDDNKILSFRDYFTRKPAIISIQIFTELLASIANINIGVSIMTKEF